MTLEEKLQTMALERREAERRLQLRAERRVVAIRESRQAKMRQDLEERRRFESVLEAELSRRESDLRVAARRAIRDSKAEVQVPAQSAESVALKSDRESAEQQRARARLRRREPDERLSPGRVPGKKEDSSELRRPVREAPPPEPARRPDERLSPGRVAARKEDSSELGRPVREVPPPAPVLRRKEDLSAPSFARQVQARQQRREHRSALPESVAIEPPMPAEEEPNPPQPRKSRTLKIRKEVALPADPADEKQAEARAEQKRSLRRQIRQTMLEETAANEALAESRAAARRTAIIQPREDSEELPETPKPTPSGLAEAELEDETEPDQQQPSAELLRLHTRGSFVLDENQQPVYLRGVTVAGLDSLSLDQPNLTVLNELWGVNVIRLPLDAQSVIAGDGSSSADQILTALDAIIETVASAGNYALLALTAADDSTAAQAWQSLAARYQKQPAALYEICAPPAAENWLERVAVLVGAVRQQSAAALIFLGNGSGGVDCTGLPLRFSTGQPVFNIVYTIGVSSHSLPNPDDGGLRELCEDWPVFASGWSDGEGSDLGRLAGVVADLFGRYGIGFAAANWNADPPLVANSSNHDFTPTGWGLAVQRALRLPVRPLLRPFAYSQG